MGSTREIGGGGRYSFAPLCKSLPRSHTVLPPSIWPSLPPFIPPYHSSPCLSLPVPLCLLAGPLYNMKFMAGLWYAHTRWYKLLHCKMNMAVSRWWLECLLVCSGLRQPLLMFTECSQLPHGCTDTVAKLGGRY